MLRIIKKIQTWLPDWTATWMGLIGIIVAMIAFLSVPFFLIINVFGLTSEYMEIFFILIGFISFIIGSGLCLFAYRRFKKAPDKIVTIKPIYLKEVEARVKFIIITVTIGLAFIFIVLSSSSVIEYTESNHFCANACHDTMQPEAVTHLNSSHSRVKCVECHISAGTSSFFHAKFSGLSRAFKVVLNIHKKPIHILRPLHPSRSSCENCHWTSKLSGDRLFTHIRYDESREDNKALYTAMLLKVGGKSGIDHKSRGIHWHTDDNLKIKYKTAADDSDVVWIEETNQKTGEKITFATEQYSTESSHKNLLFKDMSCTDCHNRVAHPAKSPEKALDEAITKGVVSRSLPWIKKQGLDFLTAEHKTSDLRSEAKTFLFDYYNKKYPDKVNQWSELITQAAEAISEVYESNIFSGMKITWDTYASNVGHMAAPGCFRCHNDTLVGIGESKGASIRSDCTLCHVFIAEDEKNPETIIKYMESR
ncbi:MAG: hypothetical protein OEV78_03385 [Spirochaetia bacterium]|nr:hypothetical protein [Spirochaetia bacterium]